MILRKPYAFLIKHFKMIHLILSAIIIYVIFQSSQIMDFMNNYVATEYFNTIKSSAIQIVPITVFLSLIAVIAISVIIIILMSKKRKPIKVYIFNIVALLAFLIINFVMFSTLKTLELQTMELRTIRIVRDLYFAISFVNYPVLIFGLIRGLGFDIKKFNFGEDVNELQIDIKDSEEFELTLSIDPDLIKRSARKKKRELGYFIKENKGSLLIISGLISVILIGTVLLNIFIYNTTYQEKQPFNIYNVITTVNNTYLTNLNYQGKKLDDNYTYVVVDFNTLNNNPYNTYLLHNYFSLYINGIRHNPIVNTLNKTFLDLGEVYYDQTLLTGKSKNYILVFKVENKLINQKMILKYVENTKITLDSLTAYYKQVTLSPKALDASTSHGTFKLGDEIKFNNTNLKETTLKINGYKIAKKFNYKYNYCLSSNNCQEITEDITPNPLASQNKVLMELDIDFKMDATINLSYIKNSYDFITYLSSINYKVGNKTYTHTQAIENRTPTLNYKGKYLYLEVIENMKNASEIEFVFNIRGQVYTYKLK